MALLADALLLVLIALPGWIVAARLRHRLRALGQHVNTLAQQVATLDARVATLEPAVPAPAREPASIPVSAVAEPSPSATPVADVAPPPLPLAARTPQSADQSLETWIGGQWTLYVGVLALLVGVAYFEKLAFESAWLGATARVAQGGLAGLLLVYGGIRFTRAGYTGYGQTIAGAGIAALYLSIYASFNFYHLIDRPAAFVLMLLVTAAGVALADRHRSQALAVFAAGGGFLTPFLLPGTTDAQIALFGYDAILVAGASILARRRAWPFLNATSYVFTVVTIAGWADRFYTPEKFLRTELFLTLFCALFIEMLRHRPGRTQANAGVAWLVVATAPIAYYLASIVTLFEHSTAFLVWIVALAAVAAFLAVRRTAAWGLGLWIALIVPLLMWCVAGPGARHLSDGLWAIGGAYALAIAAQLWIAQSRADPSAAEIVWVHTAGLTAFAAAYLLLLYDHLALTASLAAGFAIWNGLLAIVVRRERALHLAALALTLIAIAIALQFDGAAVTVGWGAEGFGAAVLGWRTRRSWLRAAGLGLFAIAAVRALDMLASPPIYGQAPIINRRAACAVFVIALAYGLAWIHERHRALRPARAIRTAAVLVAQVLTLFWITSEIRGYWSAPDASLTRELMLSVSWAGYATALIVVGLRRSFPPIRIFAIVVLALTIVKVFTVDLAHLERVYRVVSVLGLGIMLLVTSYLYQKTRGGTALGSPPAHDDESGAAAE